MAETYCTKSCSECTYKEALNCPGCKIGPGKPYGGECETAKCCRNKGHQECTTCNLNPHCGLFLSRHNTAELRKRKQEAQAIFDTEVARRAPVFGKWLWLLFWLVVPANIASLMVNDSVTTTFPFLRTPGLILSVACAAAYGLILLRLSSVEEKYRTPGICMLVVSAIELISVLVFPEDKIMLPLLTAASTIISTVCTYFEFMAHASILVGVDTPLSDKWEHLWKRYIWAICIKLGSIVAVILLSVLGLLMTLAGLVLSIYVSIMKLVYLYQTAKIFRGYAPVQLR